MNSIKKLCLVTVFAIITVFSTNLTSFATTEGIITEETVRLRKEASTSSNTISLLAKDAKVEVLDKSGDWYEVKYGENTGFVHKDYVKVQSEVPITTTNTENEVSNIEGNNTTIESEYKTVSQEQSLYIVPLINSSVIYKIAPNTNLSMIEEVNGWSYITSDKASGWIRTNKLVNVNIDAENQEEVDPEEDTLDIDEVQEVQEVTETKTGYIKVDGANLRKTASTTADILTVLYKNTEVTVVSSENGWSKVKAEGLEGYVSSELISDTKVEITTTSRSTLETRTNTSNESNTSADTTQTSASSENTSLGQQIVNFAMQYKGYPYVYGGAGPSSFDCSGFTQYVYKQFGYSLPHSATSQSYSRN